jgi:hypothetical protein
MLIPARRSAWPYAQSPLVAASCRVTLPGKWHGSCDHFIPGMLAGLVSADVQTAMDARSCEGIGTRDHQAAKERVARFARSAGKTG